MTNNNDFDAGAPTRSRAQLVTNWLLGAVVVALIALVTVLYVRDDATTADGTTPTTSVPASDSTQPGDGSSDVSTSTTPGDETTTTVADTSTTTLPESVTATSVDGSATPTVEEVAAAAVVDSWIAALGDGDGDGAWALLSEDSQDAIGGRSGFDGTFSGLAEGYGAWADATDVLKYSSAVPADPAVDLVLVTWVGTVSQEGTTAIRSFALPVVFDADGNARVEAFLRGDLVEFVIPQEGESVAGYPSISTFEFDIPSGAVPFAFTNGLLSPIQETVDLGNGKVRASVAPVGILEVGRFHVLSIVYLQTGIVHGASVPFMMEETS